LINLLLQEKPGFITNINQQLLLINQADNDYKERKCNKTAI
jgi:hypothetical protein